MTEIFAAENEQKNSKQDASSVHEACTGAVVPKSRASPLQVHKNAATVTDEGLTVIHSDEAV